MNADRTIPGGVRCSGVVVWTVVALSGLASPALGALADWGWRNPLPQGNTLSRVWCGGPNFYLAVGGGGTILRYDGSNWSFMDSGTTTWLQGVWGSSTTDIFAVGAGGTILHYDGSSWSAMASGTTEPLLTVWGTGPNDVFAVGANGTILHYNRSGWSTMTSGTTQALYAVWGSGASDVFAVGWNGTILHYNGAAWSNMTSGTTQVLFSVWGSGANDVYVGSFLGEALHYDGASWSPMTTGTENGANGLWGSSASDVYAVGRGGTVLHFPRWTVMLAIPQPSLGTGTVRYALGNQATLTALPNANCTFVRWDGDVPAGHETDNPLVLAMSDDCAITLVLQGSGPSCCAVQGGLTLPFIGLVAVLLGWRGRRGGSARSA